MMVSDASYTAILRSGILGARISSGSKSDEVEAFHNDDAFKKE
jgi:hypothetical protein